MSAHHGPAAQDLYTHFFSGNGPESMAITVGIHDATASRPSPAGTVHATDAHQGGQISVGRTA